MEHAYFDHASGRTERCRQENNEPHRRPDTTDVNPHDDAPRKARVENLHPEAIAAQPSGY